MRYLLPLFLMGVLATACGEDPASAPTVTSDAGAGADAATTTPDTTDTDTTDTDTTDTDTTGDDLGNGDFDFDEGDFDFDEGDEDELDDIDLGDSGF